MRTVLLLALILNIPLALAQPPQWAQDAVWYQIFVERFRNGDLSNDPSPNDLAGTYPGTVPSDWRVTPWHTDWYQPDSYFASLTGARDFLDNPVNSFDQKTALRRYGGDLQGVLDKLDYIQSLGINAIYFNPLNDAPSLHKYDARHWRHIDRNFGPDPKGDAALFLKETPSDPTTWQFSAADKLFLKLIDEAHQRGIKVILDYSFNHTGHTFWAWQDVLINQQNSPYADWYWVKQFDDPTTDLNEFDYRGWFGVFDLPELRETHYIDHSERIVAAEGNLFNEQAKQHIFNVTKRWLDPNNDGDPSDGIDGFRLDVAAELPFGFWREYRQVVKAINPDAYLVGEVWWEQWPDKLLDPAPFLKGDVFDGVMNYRWYRTARKLFGQATPSILPSVAVSQLRSQDSTLGKAYRFANMNMSASHDTPRLVTSIANLGKYKVDAKAQQDANYVIEKPTQQAYADARLLALFQYTYVGAPQLWAGDEMGMWGSDDPHTRKPLIWPDIEFDDEQHHPLNLDRTANKVRFNEQHHRFYQQLGQLRNQYAALRQGTLEWQMVDDLRSIVSFTRSLSNEQLTIVFNLSTDNQMISLPHDGHDLILIEGAAQLKGVELTLPPRSAVVMSLE